jgi:hypothetical protein
MTESEPIQWFTYIEKLLDNTLIAIAEGRLEFNREVIDTITQQSVERLGKVIGPQYLQVLIETLPDRRPDILQKYPSARNPLSEGGEDPSIPS